MRKITSRTRFIDPPAVPHIRRENSVQRLIVQIIHRFTPTCVGKIPSHFLISHWTTVHPHACGENSNRPICSMVVRGSPPRAWGECMRASPSHPTMRFTPTCGGRMMHGQPANYPASRFTPTCVGRMIYRATTAPLATVHPHVRGENGWKSSTTSRASGSPPRAWGECLCAH